MNHLDIGAQKWTVNGPAGAAAIFESTPKLAFVNADRTDGPPAIASAVAAPNIPTDGSRIPDWQKRVPYVLMIGSQKGTYTQV